MGWIIALSISGFIVFVAHLIWIKVSVKIAEELAGYAILASTATESSAEELLKKLLRENRLHISETTIKVIIEGLKTLNGGVVGDAGGHIEGSGMERNGGKGKKKDTELR